MDGILKVPTSLMISTAGEFSNQGSTISSLTTEMVGLVSGFGGLWEGEAASAYISKFNSLEDDIQKLVKMVQEHAADLEEMARIYEKADTQGLDAANSLPSDVIV